jgi:hypothetical protein
MPQLKETKDDLRTEILALRKKLDAANRAGLKLARCFQWDREEYQSNPELVRAVRSDRVAAKWIAEIRQLEG